MPTDLTPELKLASLKLMLRLRDLGEDGALQCEKMRSKIRTALLGNDTDDATNDEVTDILRQYTKKLEKLDGSYDMKKAAKRARLEEQQAAARKYVEDEAGSSEGELADDDGPIPSAEEKTASEH
jgi:hypothetical protein